MITPETSAEQLFFVTARLQCEKSGKGWTGTGFFVHVPVTNGDDQALLITNRHVLSHPKLGRAQTVQIIFSRTFAERQARPPYQVTNHADLA